MTIAGIDFSDAVDAIDGAELQGFCVDWKRRPDPAMLSCVLRASGRVIVARDVQTHALVGFVTAITDGHLAACITLVEVLPEYRRRGIGSELLRRMLAALGPLYMVDAVCDDGVMAFYERAGFTRGVAAMRRAPSTLGSPP